MVTVGGMGVIVIGGTGLNEGVVVVGGMGLIMIGGTGLNEGVVVVGDGGFIGFILGVVVVGVVGLMIGIVSSWEVYSETSGNDWFTS